MSEELSIELQEKLLTYLDGIEHRTEKAEQFLSTEAPVYVQELLAWEAASAALMILFYGAGILLCAIAVYVLSKVDRYLTETDEAYPAGMIRCFGCVVSLVVSLCLLVGICEYAYAFAKVKISPRLHLS